MVFIHGFGADLNAWMFTQPALAERHRTIALDLPGHGGSSRDVGAGDVGALAEAVAGALAALGIARAHLVGHSLGGAIALELAAVQPGLVASVTLIASAGLGPEINAAFIDGFVKMERRRDAQDVLRLLVHDPALLSRTMVEDVLRYKRLDGVAAALATIAGACFPGGRQASGLHRRSRRAGGAGASDLGPGRPHRPGRARRGAAGARAGPHPRQCRPPAADGESRRGEPADRPIHRGRLISGAAAKPPARRVRAGCVRGPTARR